MFLTKRNLTENMFFWFFGVFFLLSFQEACGWMMLLQRFISAATTALVAIKPSPLLQRLCVSKFSAIMIVIFVTASNSCVLRDFNVPMHCLLLLIWVMLIADGDCFVLFFLKNQQAAMSCVIFHATVNVDKTF